MRNGLTPCLWFDDDADAAVDFYVATFDDSRIVAKSHYGEGAHRPAGSTMTIEFELRGKPYMCIQGGPMFKLSEAFSMVVDCDSQEEIDRLWVALGEGGEIQACGWLKDRFGLSWQIVPSELADWMTGPQERADRVMAALQGMIKLDVAALRAAAEG